MTTSTKVSVVVAFLVCATSAASAQSVNDPKLWGGGSLGYDAGNNSSLQNARRYPHGPDPLKGAFIHANIHAASVNDPLLWGGGSLGYDAGNNSSLQNARKYPYGPDPLKGGFIYPDGLGIHVTSVNDPQLWGGGSLGYDAGNNSSLQNARKYPYGPDPLKGTFVYPHW
jgi:hypothetical protein